MQGSGPLFPFHGSGRKESKNFDCTDPGEWALDVQTIMRFPDDIATQIRDELQMEKPLDMEVEALQAAGAAKGRRWKVRVGTEELYGTLVDLPCAIESHMALPQSAAEKGAVAHAYKTANISQMLLVHREAEPPGAASSSTGFNPTTYEAASGLTPSTRRIRKRKFEGGSAVKAEFSADQVSEAVTAIYARMHNQPYMYQELVEMDEAEYLELTTQRPEMIWRPPPMSAVKSTDAPMRSARAGSAVSAGVSDDASVSTGLTQPAPARQAGGGRSRIVIR